MPPTSKFMFEAKVHKDTKTRTWLQCTVNTDGPMLKTCMCGGSAGIKDILLPQSITGYVNY